MITDGTTAVQAFEAGEIDVVYQGLPPDEIARLKETPEYEQYPGLGTYYYGFNVKNITDVKQRRAMSLAIDRQSIIDNIAQGDQLPTTGMTPQGMPGFDVINPESPWQPETADMEQAKQLMSEVANPKKNITLYINDSPGHREIAVAIQAAWKELGITSTIKQQEFQQYLEFLGPPPNSDVDVYRLGWIGDFVDAINFLDLWTCKSGNNNTNFCDKEYDAARRQGAEHAGQRRPLRHLRAARGDPRRPERRDAGHADLLVHVPEPRAGVGQGHLQHQPARPDRPDQGRRSPSSTPSRTRTGRRGAPRPAFGDTCNAGRRGSMTQVHRPAPPLDDPGAPARDLPDVRPHAADRGQPVPPHGAGRSRRRCSANLERKFNLDEPWYVQYALYVKGVFTLDLGPSLVTRDRTVNDIVKEHFPKSIELGVYAFLFAIVVGVPLG